MKTCYSCKLNFPLGEYYKDSSKKDGLTPYCRACRKIKAKKQNDKDPQKARDRAKVLRQQDALRLDVARMGMTPESYNKLLEEQDYKCAICKSHETVLLSGNVRRLSIDHDHKCCYKRRDVCGSCNRGLLCSRCNLMLGYAQDNLTILASAVEYLEKYNK